MFNSYTYKDVLTRASTTIQIIDDTTLYKASIFSSNGNIFNINDVTSQLTLLVRKGIEDITYQFTDIVWSRFSANTGQYEEDLVWGEQHKGKTTFTLHRDDILEKANIQVAVYAEINGERTLVAADFISFTDINDMKGSPIPPNNPADGDIWVDTSTNPPSIKVWDDEKKQWVDIVIAGTDKRNLIRNSNFYKKTFDYWDIIGSPTLQIESLKNKKWARITNMNNNSSGQNGLSQTFLASKKTDYCFQAICGVLLSSFYPSGAMNVTVNSINKNKIKTLITEKTFKMSIDIENFNFSFLSLSDTNEIEIIISNEKDSNCDFIFTNVKVEKGTVPTEWEIAIEDIQDALDNKINNTHEDIFNSLTNNGKLEGLYTDVDEEGNKHFYFNASYIKSGYISGEYINAKNLIVYRNDGVKTLEIDDKGNVTFKGKIQIESDETGDFEDPATVNDIAYKVDIISNNGLIFYNGQVSTTLSARVYKGRNEITDNINEERFRWIKVLEDGTEDVKWNNNFGLGKKTITVTNNDVNKRCTFKCEILE